MTKINQAVGFRLLTKFGSKGVVNLWKAVPVAGAFVGGAFDSVTTKIIGPLADRLFQKRVLLLETVLLFQKTIQLKNNNFYGYAHYKIFCLMSVFAFNRSKMDKTIYCSTKG